MHIRDYIEHLKRKPEHVKQRIAFGAASGITAVVAMGWLVAFTSSDALALTPPDPETTQSLTEASEETQRGFSELLGAASAFNAAASGEQGLMIVDGEESSTIESAPEEDTRTVIPF